MVTWGQPLFAVIAETREAARRASRLARIEYRDLPHQRDVDAARANGNKEAFQDKKNEAKEYFIEQFTKMLDDNIADYEANFDKYRG